MTGTKRKDVEWNLKGQSPMILNEYMALFLELYLCLTIALGVYLSVTDKERAQAQQHSSSVTVDRRFSTVGGDNCHRIILKLGQKSPGAVQSAVLQNPANLSGMEAICGRVLEHLQQNLHCDLSRILYLTVLLAVIADVVLGALLPQAPLFVQFQRCQCFATKLQCMVSIPPGLSQF
ncbi:hypothetical protein KIL84_017061 [Mauremys mutica]|uniref:Uncharacterized protein n=1 Tax=Mauremys mutica TaxID=74926 RepID=A0A9D3X5L3_9SAUR|nr:hypothetical protein KIL84_017061 [Mauremys mutica]